ncbi:MAG: HD domain-containing protein [Lachnospiraceae bacterium]|nr:HD domain-containing protein [Lachnospiraceae bacterium]
MKNIKLTREEKLLDTAIAYDHGDAKRIQHFIKVYTFAKMIGIREGLSVEMLNILSAAAILHDIGIHKAEELYGKCDGKLQEELGPDIARTLLTQNDYTDQEADRICFLIRHHHTYTEIDGMDYRILVEADFLVNFYEDEFDEKAAAVMEERIFRTEAGKELLHQLIR